jgi:hypothetical protein
MKRKEMKGKKRGERERGRVARVNTVNRNKKNQCLLFIDLKFVRC